MGLRLKREGNSPCTVKGVRPETVLAMFIAASLWGKLFKGMDCIVTSCTDSHADIAGSLHPTGFAFDIRIRSFPLPIKENVELAAQALRDSLSDEYDVVVESDHIHVEFDPK
jgi:hypothetical protein